MLKYFYKKSAIFLCFICVCVVANAADSKIKLKTILRQITQVQTDINQKEKQQVSVEQQLRKLQVKIKKLEINCQKTIKDLQQQTNILVQLNNDQAKQLSKLQEIRQKFAVQVKAAYQIEQPDYFKTIIYKESYLDSAVFLTYHKYLFTARLKQMHNIKQTVDRIRLNRQQIMKQAKILEDLENKQQQQKQELVQTQLERNAILKELKNKITSQNQRLKQLVSAKKNLEELIARLSVSGMHKAIALSPSLITKLCQDFVWPTTGKVAVHFGSPIEQSSWSWNGIIIAAPEDQIIKAISSGTVVYADWLSGYGLLLIIDHGNGYMSLYGYNNNFRKKLHDRVIAGEIIATVGKSSREESGLYFSVRYNGKPVNPEKWCKI